MRASDIPVKMPTIWAADAGSSFIRTVPVASQIGIQNGAASFETGYPPDTFTPVAAGGVPPFGQDFNGINNAITAWLQWAQAGGGILFYDPTFATEVGGYFNGAMLQATSGPGNFWISTVDNNTSNPDMGGSGWIAFPGPALVYPSYIQKSNTTYNFNCQTDYSLGLLRSAPAAMVANIGAVGTLGINQVFEVADLSGNLSLGLVTVNPPAGHVIAGATTFVMTNDRQKCRFKYYGTDLGTGYWDIEIGG